jgi:RsiW-degrading membrane proteinase PrsW (M82 family)
MLKIIESFVWGIIVAFTALILENFIEILFEIFFPQINFNFQYTDPSHSFTLIIISILTVAIIEESLKFIILKKRIFNDLTNHFVLTGALLGFGFATFEVLLASQKSEFFTDISINFILATITLHVILGIFSALGLAKFSKYYIMILAFVIILHTSFNLIVLSLIN